MHACPRATAPSRPTGLPPVVYEREPGAASRPLPRSYRRREPEKTVLHEVIRDHLESFLEDGRSSSPTGEGYPRFIEHEFRRYLSCGLLAGG